LVLFANALVAWLLYHNLHFLYFKQLLASLLQSKAEARMNQATTLGDRSDELESELPVHFQAVYCSGERETFQL